LLSPVDNIRRVKFNAKGIQVVSSRRCQLALSVILITLVTLVSFLSSLDNDFVNYDDTAHVTQNPLIRDLSWNNIKGIFSTPVISNSPLLSLVITSL